MCRKAYFTTQVDDFLLLRRKGGYGLANMSSSTSTVSSAAVRGSSAALGGAENGVDDVEVKDTK